MCYGNFRNKMRFIQRYKSPKFIGIGDKVRYQNNIYDVLVNYIVGETDATGYTPKVNRTILIDNNNRKVVVNDYKLLEIIAQWKIILHSIIYLMLFVMQRRLI